MSKFLFYGGAINLSEKTLNQTIYLKQYISEKEYKDISQLEKLCNLHDKTNLKLELDYRMNMRRSSEIVSKNTNEFLYYIEDTLVSYLGISSYGGTNIGEINGMTHPDFRRKGLFTKLFELAINESHKRSFNKLLLLSDGKSSSGIEFIKTVGSTYDFSEYRMKALNKTTFESTNSINIRKAGKLDGKEIAKQNVIFFNDSEECECFPEEDEKINKITYMVELNKTVIGKITVDYSDSSAFISGVGILPNFRGNGYAKEALKQVLQNINERNLYDIELDVECKNNNALNLYKACGFEEISVMNYYKCHL